MASSSPSLRNLYKNHPDIWTFPQANQTASSPSSSSVLGSSKWDGQIKSQSTSSLAALRDEEDTVVSANIVLNGLLASALLQYATTAIAMPLEVGKLLLQIQYVPQEMDHWEAEPTLAEEVEQEVRTGCNSLDIY
jgi:fusion and transport protein UGO1